jgi:hypothetical protein
MRPRPHRTNLASCSAEIAAGTPDLCTPTLAESVSWVTGKPSPSTGSCICRSQRTHFWDSECRALQAAGFCCDVRRPIWLRGKHGGGSHSAPAHG